MTRKVLFIRLPQGYLTTLARKPLGGDDPWRVLMFLIDKTHRFKGTEGGEWVSFSYSEIASEVRLDRRRVIRAVDKLESIGGVIEIRKSRQKKSAYRTLSTADVPVTTEDDSQGRQVVSQVSPGDGAKVVSHKSPAGVSRVTRLVQASNTNADQFERANNKKKTIQEEREEKDLQRQGGSTPLSTPRVQQGDEAPWWEAFKDGLPHSIRRFVEQAVMGATLEDGTLWLMFVDPDSLRKAQSETSIAALTDAAHEACGQDIKLELR